MTTTKQKTLNERFFEAFDELKRLHKVKNQTAFATKIGLLSTHWSGYREEKRRINEKHIAAVVSHFGISRQFLIEGTGSMFADSASHNDVSRSHNDVKSETPGLHAHELAAGYGRPSPPASMLAVAMASDLPFVDLPLVGIHARAGFAEMGGLRPDPRAFDTFRVWLDLGESPARYRDAVVFEVFGDSMEPAIPDGTHVVAWPVSEGRWDQLHNTAVVVSYDDTVTVKKIKGNDLSQRNRLTLHAVNDDYGYFAVERRLIHSVWNELEFARRSKVRV